MTELLARSRVAKGRDEQLEQTALQAIPRAARATPDDGVHQLIAFHRKWSNGERGRLARRANEIIANHSLTHIHPFIAAVQQLDRKERVQQNCRELSSSEYDPDTLTPSQ